MNLQSSTLASVVDLSMTYSWSAPWQVYMRFRPTWQNRDMWILAEGPLAVNLGHMRRRMIPAYD